LYGEATCAARSIRSYATSDIAEDLIFLVEGRDVRHRAE